MSRTALADLRAVIALLKTDTPAALTPDLLTPATMTDVVDEAQRRLTKAGFIVDRHPDREDAPTDLRTNVPALRSITREAVNNILKHAEPRSHVTINADIEEGFAEVTFKNRRRTRGAPQQGLGLTSMTERATLSGGHVISRPSHEYWVTQISTPVRPSR